MIMVSGVNYGYRRSIPHLLGIVLGYPILIIAVGFGLGAVFIKFPQLHLILKILGVIYLSYLAYKIATTPLNQTNSTIGEPFSFVKIAMLQWVNPKGWVGATVMTTTYAVAGTDYFIHVLIIALTAITVGIFSANTWLIMGNVIRIWLTNPFWLRLFNYLMSSILVISILPAILELYKQLTSEAPIF